jgi:DNA-binding XRE family transcriptional regulator
MENTNKLKGLRTEHKLSQHEMAKILGCVNETYCMKEQGKREFCEREINIILKMFDRKYEDIFLDRRYAIMEQEG